MNEMIVAAILTQIQIENYIYRYYLLYINFKIWKLKKYF